jgi:hypothetical protein
MADIEFRPDQQVPAGRYYVILRRVQEMPPAGVPPDVVEILPPGDEEYGAGANMANPNVGQPGVPPNIGPAIVPPVASAEGENNIAPGDIGMQGGKRGKNMKNTKKAKKSKGTRKLSGYMKFAQEVRPRIIKENPALRTDIPGIGRKIGEMWRNLSAAEKARY